MTANQEITDDPPDEVHDAVSLFGNAPNRLSPTSACPKLFLRDRSGQLEPNSNWHDHNPDGSGSRRRSGKCQLEPERTASGTEGRSVGGEYANETFKGTYSVNSGCRGTATIQFFESGQLVRTSVLTILFDDNSSEIRMVQQSLKLPDGTQLPVVITVEGRKH
jgi:hypothetical protein